jgi:hypothetical protein
MDLLGSSSMVPLECLRWVVAEAWGLDDGGIMAGSEESKHIITTRACFP